MNSEEKEDIRSIIIDRLEMLEYNQIKYMSTIITSNDLYSKSCEMLKYELSSFRKHLFEELGIRQ